MISTENSKAKKGGMLQEQKVPHFDKAWVQSVHKGVAGDEVEGCGQEPKCERFSEEFGLYPEGSEEPLKK